MASHKNRFDEAILENAKMYSFRGKIVENLHQIFFISRAMEYHDHQNSSVQYVIKPQNFDKVDIKFFTA